MVVFGAYLKVILKDIEIHAYHKKCQSINLRVQGGIAQ